MDGQRKRNLFDDDDEEQLGKCTLPYQIPSYAYYVRN